MVLKPLKIRPPWHVLLDYFTARPSYKILYDTLLTNWPKMLKMCKHLKCFQFQLCHQRVLFKCLHIFSISDQLVKKVSYRFLKDSLVVKWSSKTYQGVSFLVILVLCIASILKLEAMLFYIYTSCKASKPCYFICAQVVGLTHLTF